MWLCPHLTICTASGQECQQPRSSLPEPCPHGERQPDPQWLLLLFYVSLCIVDRCGTLINIVQAKAHMYRSEENIKYLSLYKCMQVSCWCVGAKLMDIRLLILHSLPEAVQRRDHCCH